MPNPPAPSNQEYRLSITLGHHHHHHHHHDHHDHHHHRRRRRHHYQSRSSRSKSRSRSRSSSGNNYVHCGTGTNNHPDGLSRLTSGALSPAGGGAGALDTLPVYGVSLSLFMLFVFHPVCMHVVCLDKFPVSAEVGTRFCKPLSRTACVNCEMRGAASRC